MRSVLQHLLEKCIEVLEINAHGNTGQIDSITSGNAETGGNDLKILLIGVNPAEYISFRLPLGLGDGQMAQSLAMHLVFVRCMAHWAI